MSDERIENALYAVHSRLGVIEGKVNLVARAERKQLLDLLEQTVRADPLLGQIYLMLDGNRTQTQIREALAGHSIQTSAMSISRRMRDMETEHGIADLVQTGNANVYMKDPAMEKVLNLSKNVQTWLAAEGQAIPETQPRRRRPSS